MVLKLEVLLVVRRQLVVVVRQEVTHGSNTCVGLHGMHWIDSVFLNFIHPMLWQYAVGPFFYENNCYENNSNANGDYRLDWLNHPGSMLTSVSSTVKYYSNDSL